MGSIPGLGRSPGEGKCYPLQYSDLENSMACIVHRVIKSRTWLSNFHFHFRSYSSSPSYVIFSFLWLGHFTVQPYLLSSHSCACFDFSFRAGKVVCLLILFPPKFPRRAYREIQVIQMWNTVVWFLVQSLIIKNCCMILNSLVDISKHQSILHL